MKKEPNLKKETGHVYNPSMNDTKKLKHLIQKNLEEEKKIGLYLKLKKINSNRFYYNTNLLGTPEKYLRQYA